MEFELRQDERDGLVLVDAEGVAHRRVRPLRLFPLSDAERWIAVCDAAGQELVTIEEPASLPEAARRVLFEELSRHEFRPVIERIVSISARTTPSEWSVVTDRGPTRFLLGSDDDLRPLGPQGLLIVDAHGIQYFVSDVRKLDAGSRRLLNQVL